MTIQFTSNHLKKSFRAARLQHIFQNYFGELMRKWTHIVQNKLNSHAEKLVIMEKIQSDSTIDESSLSAREIMRAVKNVSFVDLLKLYFVNLFDPVPEVKLIFK